MKRGNLQIAKGFRIPVDVVTQSLGVVAQRGAGKTYFASVLLEELIGAGVPVCALDPIGVMWGLRLGANGKRKGLRVIILGGDHGDIPLEAGAGSVVADWVISERRPCVLDLSSFRKNEQRQFVTDFAERLYRKNRSPLHLVLDEADLFAPQRPMPGEQRMLGAFEDLVRRGRARGIGLTLITQRPAVIHKDVLTQVSALVALRMVGPQDIKAVDGWIQSHGTAEDRKRVLNSLPSLPIGEAWFWSPGWLGLLKRIKVRQRSTYDSSKAPSLKDSKIAPPSLAPVDLKSLKGKMAEVVDRAKADDPKVLRACVRELERELSKGGKTPDTKEITRLEAECDKWIARCGELEELVRATNEVLKETSRSITGVIQKGAKPTKRTVRKHDPDPDPDPEPTRRKPVKRSDGPGVKLPKGECAILIVTAQHNDGVTREQLTVMTGYKRSSRDAYIQRLREKGFVETGDKITATDEGIKALGSDYEPLPEGKALRDHWLERLPEGERKVLQIAIDEYPGFANREEISNMTDYKRSSRDAYIQRLKARQLVTTNRDGVRASDNLF